jgi:hypothetical protein
MPRSLTYNAPSKKELLANCEQVVKGFRSQYGKNYTIEASPLRTGNGSLYIEYVVRPKPGFDSTPKKKITQTVEEQITQTAEYRASTRSPRLTLRVIRKKYKRKCIKCGEIAYPNYFYCPSCHGRVRED